MPRDTAGQIVGSIVADVVSWAITGVIIYYAYLVFWVGAAPDFEFAIKGKNIPPESYAIILVVLWAGAESLQARAQLDNNWSRFFSIAPSAVFGGFLSLTIFLITYNGPDTYIGVFIAFVLAAVFDLVFHFLSWFTGSASRHHVSDAGVSTENVVGMPGSFSIVLPNIDRETALEMCNRHPGPFIHVPPVVTSG